MKTAKFILAIFLLSYSITAFSQKDTLVIDNVDLRDSFSHHIDSTNLTEFTFRFTYLQELDYWLTFVSPFPYFTDRLCQFHKGGKYKIVLATMTKENARPYSYYKGIFNDSIAGSISTKNYRKMILFNDICKFTDRWDMLRIARSNEWRRIVSIEPCDCYKLPEK